MYSDNMTRPLTTTLVIYTKNEIDGMRVIMPQIQKKWCDEVIVIDGQSTDGTVEYCHQHGYTIYTQTEPSWAGAYKEGHKRATGDIIIDFSPDGNSKPEAIPVLIQKLKEGYDLVLASRYLGGAKSEDDTWITHLGNQMFTFAINFLFGQKFTDTLVIFRAYRRQLVEQTLLDTEIVHAFTPQLCIRAAKLNKKWAEIPADEPKRIGGVPKMKVLYCGWLAVEIILREWLDMGFKKRVEQRKALLTHGPQSILQKHADAPIS